MLRININRKNNYIWILSRKYKSTIKIYNINWLHFIWIPSHATDNNSFLSSLMLLHYATQLLLSVPFYLFEAITVHFYQVFWGWKSNDDTASPTSVGFWLCTQAQTVFFHFCYFQDSFLYCKCTFPSKNLNHLCATVFDAWAWLYLPWFSTKLLFSLENRMRMQVLSSLKPEHCKIRLESWRRFYLELACVKMNFHGLLIQENQNVIGRKWYFDVCNPSLYFNIPLLRNRLNCKVFGFMQE